MSTWSFVFIGIGILKYIVCTFKMGTLQRNNNIVLSIEVLVSVLQCRLWFNKFCSK